MEEVQSGEMNLHGDFRIKPSDIDDWLVEKEIDSIRAWKSITVDDIPDLKKEAFLSLKPHIDALISDSIYGTETERALKEQEIN